MNSNEPRNEGGQLDTRILSLRGRRVMLSTDLAAIYGVRAKVLVQAVKRNAGRFPVDFMFRPTWEEVESLAWASGSRSQIVTLKRGSNVKHLPYAFTQEGVAMLSSVLRSPRAVRVNIEIMRAFVRIRQLAGTHSDVIRRLVASPDPPRRQIGFTPHEGRSGSGRGRSSE